MAGPSEVTVEIVTTSKVNPKWNTPAQVPKITLNGNPFPTPKNGVPGLTSGWQLVVIDSTKDMTDPASTLVNAYFVLTPDSAGYWNDTYGWTYDNMGRYILGAGDPDTQLVFLASYGWDQNAPPTAFFLQQMLGLGAGKGAQQWALYSDRGSEVGWVSFPTSYILIGGSAFEYGLGHEAFADPGNGQQATAQVTANISNP